MFDFSLIGFAGYVAPRHLSAIKETGNRLISAFDIQSPVTDSVHSLFPNASLFNSFETYNDFHEAHSADYISICSPNDQHFKQIEWALEKGSHVICEKPIVIDPNQLLLLTDMEKRAGRKINTILQLRALDQVIALKKEVGISKIRHQIDLTYLSIRDEQYFNSWKADEVRSGGLITNIGIHLFDLVLWLYGPVIQSIVFKREKDHATGYLVLEKADVRWLLDIKGELLSKFNGSTFRELKINGIPVRLDQGLQQLHHTCYEEILTGNGLGIGEAGESISLCNQLNNQEINELDIKKYIHPLLKDH